MSMRVSERDADNGRRLNGIAALDAAMSTPMKVLPGERHTEFVKRIVSAYLDALEKLEKNSRR